MVAWSEDLFQLWFCCWRKPTQSLASIDLEKVLLFCFVFSLPPYLLIKTTRSSLLSARRPRNIPLLSCLTAVLIPQSTRHNLLPGNSIPLPQDAMQASSSDDILLIGPEGPEIAATLNTLGRKMQADAGKRSSQKLRSWPFWQNFWEPTEQGVLGYSTQSEGEVAASGLSYPWGNGRMPREPLDVEGNCSAFGHATSTHFPRNPKGRRFWVGARKWEDFVTDPACQASCFTTWRELMTQQIPLCPKCHW